MVVELIVVDVVIAIVDDVYIDFAVKAVATDLYHLCRKNKCHIWCLEDFASIIYKKYASHMYI